MTKNKPISNKIRNRVSLLREISEIKLSLLWFIHWSETSKKEIALTAQSVTSRLYVLAWNRGRLDAIADLKASRLAFTRWLCGRPLQGHVGAPITKLGLPKVIPQEVRAKLIREPTDDLIKGVMTCLGSSRHFKGGKPVDIESITAGSNPELPKDSEVILALRKLGIAPGQERPYEWKFNWIVTAGPNGPSISSSLQDLPKFNELFRSQVDVILPDLLPIIDKLLTWEKTFRLSSLLKLDKFRDSSLRKIAIKDDREGKSRPFAIFDYWSQTVLTPLHDWAFVQLRGIPQDCTFDQPKGVTIMNNTKSRKNFYSYDLKSATDRFPVLLQEKVLSLVFDTDYAKAWSHLMTKEPFRLQGYEEPIKFGAGQPLGAKSSWAIFTLCHHLVVHIAAIRSNSEAHYVILGDDIVLRGRALATEYKRIMSDLGVSISEQKSHVSSNTFEFAKIWSHKGRNLSGFPISGLASTLTKPLELAALFVFELPNKGYHYNIDPRSVSHFFSPIADYNVLPPRLAIFMANKVAWYYSFLSWLVTKDGGWAKYLAQSASVVTSKELANNLFSQVIKESWAKQLDKTLENFWQFGIDMLTKIRELPPFKPVWDPKSYPGRMDTSGIEFNAPVRNVPIFAALQQESRVALSDYIQSVLEDEDQKLSLEEIDQLRLAPRPQLKGFEPIRSKENIRTLSLISRKLNSELMIKCRGITEDAKTHLMPSSKASLGKGVTFKPSLRDVMAPAMSISHSGSLPWMKH